MNSQARDGREGWNLDNVMTISKEKQLYSRTEKTTGDKW
jgi:hypothetical protein